MNFRRHNQTRIRKLARGAAEHVLSSVESFNLVTDKERDILTDITFRLLVKYFNGRELRLLSEDYLIAEGADTLIEHNKDIVNASAMAAAVAQIAAELGKFFVKHDTKETGTEQGGKP